MRNVFFGIFSVMLAVASVQSTWACEGSLSFNTDACANEIVDIISQAAVQSTQSSNDEAIRRCFADCMASNPGPGPELKRCVTICQSRYGRK